MMSKERVTTNLLLMDLVDCWDEFTIKKDEEDSNTKALYNNIAKVLDETFSKHLNWLDSPEAARYFRGEADYKRGLFDDIDEEISTIISDNKKEVSDIIDKIYETGQKKGYKDIKRRVTFSDRDQQALKHLKYYDYHLIRNLNNNLKSSIQEEIFKGVIRGDGVSEIASRIKDRGIEPLPESTLNPYQRAVMIARTEKSRAENNAILQSYANYGVEYVDWMTKGVNVCKICLLGESYNPYLMSSVKGLIPAHPNCGCRWTAHILDELDNQPLTHAKYMDLILGNRLPFIRDADEKPLLIIGDTAEGKAYFLENYAVTGLSQKEYEFYQMYTSSGDKAINGFLRGILSKEEARQEWNNGLLNEPYSITFDDALEISKTIFDKGIELQEDIVVVRRENNRYMDENDDGEHTLEGMTSVSIASDINPEEYGQNMNYIILRKGMRISYLEGISSTKEEFEILLPHGSKLEHIRDLGDTVKVWEVTE